jgi:D-tyrosyl-tRNA(Tyr) deacylase
MRAVIQRVEEASVSVNQRVVGIIKRGLVVLLGISRVDEKADAKYLAAKIPQLRIFNDGELKMNLSLKDVGGKILVISQFTLFANTRKGRRPSFIESATPEMAEPLYKYFIKILIEEGVEVEKGIFGAMMLVKIYNDGPVTILMDSDDRHKTRNSVEY